MAGIPGIGYGRCARLIGGERSECGRRRNSRSAIGTSRAPQGEWFLDAELQLLPGDPQSSVERIRELLERRGRTQPIGLASCGSVFRNPPGDHAARLIEIAGLKGLRMGGAQVSEKHANFIINTGDATAADIARLIERVKTEVERVSGVRLIPEVRRVGE